MPDINVCGLCFVSSSRTWQISCKAKKHETHAEPTHSKIRLRCTTQHSLTLVKRNYRRNKARLIASLAEGSLSYSARQTLPSLSNTQTPGLDDLCSWHSHACSSTPAPGPNLRKCNALPYQNRIYAANFWTHIFRILNSGIWFNLDLTWGLHTHFSTIFLFVQNFAFWSM